VIAIDLSGRVALVTGAGAGIGREIAVTLARAGARVAVNDVDGARADETVALARDAAGVDAFPFVGDVTDEATAHGIVADVVARFGTLDVAVSNVGMMGGLGPRPFVDVDGAYARKLVDLNLFAALWCGVAAGRVMRAQGRGVIVNVSSGETTRAAPGLAVYGAAKAAVNHLTRSMAVELGPHGVRVHAVAPGTTPTETVRAALTPEHLDAIAASTPLGRLGTPADLAALVAFLACDLAAAVTGQLVLADLGAHLSTSRPQVPVPGGPPPGPSDRPSASGV
jgi:NAD(P)-dependent dehydrogenase (short-subunit alcohol dehydrogenase family)